MTVTALQRSMAGMSAAQPIWRLPRWDGQS